MRDINRQAPHWDFSPAGDVKTYRHNHEDLLIHLKKMFRVTQCHCPFNLHISFTQPKTNSLWNAWGLATSLNESIAITCYSLLLSLHTNYCLLISVPLLISELNFKIFVLKMWMIMFFVTMLQTFKNKLLLWQFLKFILVPSHRCYQVCEQSI